MPPKGKKKRASLHLDASSGQIKAEDEKPVEEKKATPVRQVVEVVDDTIPEAVETLKRDAEEIEDTAETIEQEVKEELHKDEPKEEYVPPVHAEEVSENGQGSVESLFAKTTSPVTPEITVVGKKDRSIGVWVGAVIGLALAIGVSLILFVRKPLKLPAFMVKPTPTPTQTPAPTPTPVPAVSRADITVSVVNGGGTPGAAGKMQAFLESKGYKVSGVSNADSYTYTDTEIDVKSGKDAVANLLKQDLQSDYSLSSTVGTVPDSASYDAQVIVGK